MQKGFLCQTLRPLLEKSLQKVKPFVVETKNNIDFMTQNNIQLEKVLTSIKKKIDHLLVRIKGCLLTSPVERD